MILICPPELEENRLVLQIPQIPNENYSEL